MEAIDQVRGIGNIGAHMEKDIDLIVDVDPNEAKVLIEHVEMLFEEWYVSRHVCQERLERIKLIAETKQEAQKGQNQQVLKLTVRMRLKAQVSRRFRITVN